MVVVPDPKQTNTKEIASAIDELLVARGFAMQAKDAYDELTGQDTVRDYAGGDLMVSVALDQPGAVYVRVSERSETFSDDAQRFVEAFSNELDRKYPGAVRRQP